MAVFLDVLPRLGLTEAEGAMAKLKDMAAKTGKEMGLSIGEGASSGLDKLKADSITAERSVSDNFRKMTVSAQLYEAQVKKVAEVEAARGRDSAAYAVATARQTDLQMKATQATKDHEVAALTAAGASGKFAAAEEAKSGAVVNTSKVLNGIGMASFLTFGAAIAVSADKAADFEQSQTKLVASAGESAAGLKKVSDGILQMAGTVGYSAGQLSDAMYVVEKGGFSAAKGGLDVLSAAAQGANAEQADLAEVTKGLTISMNDFHFPTQNAADVMSKLVVATGASTATFQEFTGALHSVEPAAAAAGIKYEDLLATIAQGTKSGASADQVTENIRNAISALSGAQAPARAAMAQLGISADDVSQHLGERGLAGTMQYLADTIKAKMDPNNLIPTGTFKQNAQELDNMTASLNAMSPAARALAEGLRNGSVDALAFRKGLAGSSGDDTQRLRDFQKMSNDLDDFSKRFKNGQSTLETYNQALRDVTGTVAGQTIALQVTGDNADATNALIAKLTGTTREHDGTVKGFNETQDTLNAKMRDAKAAFGAAAIELGDVFIPELKDAADALKATAEFIAAHKDAVKDAVIVVGVLGTTWAVTKVAMALGNTVSALATGMASIGGFVSGLAGKYDVLAASATAAADAEAAAAGAGKGGFAKGAAAGTATRSAVAKSGLAALPIIGELWAASENDPFAPGGAYDKNGDQTPEALQKSLWQKYHPGETPPTDISKYDNLGPSKGPHGSHYTPKGDGALPVAQGTPGVDPGTPGSGIDTPGGAAKKPKGDKNDPIWIAPKDPSDFKSDTDHGVTGSSIIKNGPDFSPKGIGTFFSALLIDLAVGNPIGKTLAKEKEKAGQSAQNPMYVTSVDVDRAQDRLNKAIQDNGPDSEEAKHAAGQLAGTRAAVGTTGGYYDPKTGGITARDPSKSGGTYGLPAGTNSGGYGGNASMFPDWVNKLGANFGVKPSTYPGHQETDRNEPGYAPNPQHLNRAIDWSGPVANMQKFAEYLKTIPQDLEQVIWKNPGTGQEIGVGGGKDVSGSYYSQTGEGSYQEHDNHVHTRQSAPIPLPGDSGDPTDLSDLSGSGLGGGFGLGGVPDSPVFKRDVGPFPTPGGVTTPGLGNSFGLGLGGTGKGGNGFTPPAPNAAPGSDQGQSSKPGIGNSVANNPRSWGSGKGASSSIGSTLAGAAGGIADMFAPGSSVVAQKAGQLADRTIGYGAQVGGIAVEGLMQSLIPTGGGGGIGDPSHSLVGRIAGGVAGAHKSAPNAAGTTAAPGPKKDDDKAKPQGDTNHNIGQQQNGGINTQGGDVHITAPSPQAFASDQPQNIYPTATR